MPADHGLRGDDDERTFPSGPESPSGDPKQFVQGAELGLGMPAFQHGELVAERQVLQEQCAMRTKATSQ
ncbi:MAG: hypothetical protein DMG82_05110 [Acidobacteria bacterium]|nr:MAG: hypothetical protein DMG82_05110 [Acidobacteriota bacterium]